MPALWLRQGSRALIFCLLTMEDSMAKEMGKPALKFELPAKLEFENAADATGFWFAAAVLFAVLAAVIIVYRIGDADTRMASNDIVPVAAQSSPAAPATILPR
jgi:hypothetical protein